MTRLLTRCVAIAFVFVSFAWAEPIALEVVRSPDQRWDFRRLAIFHDSQGMGVAGRLNARTDSGLPSGHVDLAAFGVDGQLLEATTAAYQPGKLTPTTRKKGGVRFVARFASPLPQGALIKVAFHRDGVPSAGEKPAHQDNIAAAADSQ